MKIQKPSELLFAEEDFVPDWSLATMNPTLASEWHPYKNDLTPMDVVSNSHKKAWWLCKCGCEWEAPINNRNRGSGCPKCHGTPKKTHPQYLKELDAKKITIIPLGLYAGGKVKIQHQCDRCNNIFLARPVDVLRGHGCPYCDNKKSYDGNCLASVFPEVAKLWDVYLNGELTPADFTPGSGRSVWWRNSEYEPFKGRICDEVQKFKSRKMTALRNVG